MRTTSLSKTLWRLWLLAGLMLGCLCIVQANTSAPVLLSEPASTRALAFTSPTYLREPFQPTCRVPLCQGEPTRIIIFVMNLRLQVGEAASVVAAEAEDAAHRHYELQVEAVAPVGSYDWLNAVVFKLPSDLNDVGDVLVRVAYGGAQSNRVRIGIGHIGGGPPDDEGASPTPAPPFVLSGLVTDGRAALAGVTLMLQGAQATSFVTAADGQFSFGDLASGASYTITPLNPRYTFNPLSLTFDNLYANASASFTGTPNNFTINGRVATPAGVGLSGLTVSLEGGAGPPRTTTTDAQGRYSFAAVQAASDYVVTTNKAHYTFNPARLRLTDLAADTTADFTALIDHFQLSGYIGDEGHPFGGIAVQLSGTQTATTYTNGAGAYIFSVPAEGDYTITPSEQHFYTYAPQSQSFANVVADQMVNFIATPAEPASPQQVLAFDGTPQTVDYGMFFDEGVNLGHFFWEFWAMPGPAAGSTYLLSDGYGGAHALLFGFSLYGSSEPGRYQFFGDVWDGTDVIYFSSDEGPAIGEWGHYAVGWDGREIITYLNGVPCGRLAFTGPRRTYGPAGGGGRLLIGGSDHSNFNGRIAQVRGFEGYNPREQTERAGPSITAPRAAFAPDTLFRRGGQLLSNYFSPAQTVADLSPGLNGQTHPGRLRGTPFPYGLLIFCEECPRPQYVVDPSAPNFATQHAPAPQQFTPPQPPHAALVFDSFTRPNATYALGGSGGLGMTEGSSLDALVWQSVAPAAARQPFGIQNGRVVILADETAMAWLSLAPAAPGDLEIRADRHAGLWGSGLDTGLSFRVADAQNYFFAYTGEQGPDEGVRALTVGYYAEGTRTDLATKLPLPRGWKTLRVVTLRDGTLSVYADATLVYTTTNELLATANGVGLYNDRAGLGLTNRWDNFTVYAAP
ncbi:MAG TPA: carboxypeptidase regulatory-like domain-containing protein [Pyrinomonadaceae bacterium]